MTAAQGRIGNNTKNCVSGTVPVRCRSDQIGAKEPRVCSLTPSVRSCAPTTSSPRARIVHSGSHTSTPRMIIAHPRDQITPPKYHGTNVHAYSITVNSRKMSHSPRVHRNFATFPVVPDFDLRRYAPVPARKKNSGAQKWVIQRVKKSAG